MPAFAGVWLQENGKGQVITTLRYYTTQKFFDVDGNKRPIKKFTKLDAAPYFEYGLTPKVTLGGEIDFAGIDDDLLGLEYSYSNIFARSYLYKSETSVVSIEPGVTFPASLGTDLTSDGNKPIPELKLGYGKSFKLFDRFHFFDASAKYRYRSDPDLRDMIKLETTISFSITDDFTVLGQFPPNNLSAPWTAIAETII